MQWSEKVLVVDDDPDMREALQMILESAGYTVTTAENGEQCLAILETQRPDLLLLDLLMPKMDGLEVCRILRNNGHSAKEQFPIIILSSVQEAVSQRRFEFQTGTRLHVDGYVEKPVESSLLLERVKETLQNNGKKS